MTSAAAVLLAPVFGGLTSLTTSQDGSVVALDLAAVTAFDAASLRALNRVHAAVVAAGWTFRVTPPEAAEPRAAFLRAAARREFDWAR